MINLVNLIAKQFLTSFNDDASKTNELFKFSIMESLILAQDERWRRA